MTFLSLIVCLMCGHDWKQLKAEIRGKRVWVGSYLKCDCCGKVKEDPDYDDLHYKVIAFLCKRRRIQPLDTVPPM